MRIDYSEPKKSYSSTPPLPSLNRPRKESSGTKPFVIIFTSIVSLVIGFGSGWMLSQRSAKQGFQAATEQQSLENTPAQPVAKTQTPPTKPATATSQTPDAPQSQTQAGQAGAPVTAEQPLSFYKTLPSGQKNNVLGSGINPQDKPARQPLQAAIPTNITKAPQPQNPDENPKQPAQSAPAKAAGRQETNSSFTVQVASYSLRSEAETFRGKLTGKGYNVYITESHLGDKGTWYRVRVGKHLEQDAAKELAAKLGKGAMAVPERD